MSIGENYKERGAGRSNSVMRLRSDEKGGKLKNIIKRFESTESTQKQPGNIRQYMMTEEEVKKRRNEEELIYSEEKENQTKIYKIPPYHPPAKAIQKTSRKNIYRTPVPPPCPKNSIKNYFEKKLKNQVSHEPPKPQKEDDFWKKEDISKKLDNPPKNFTQVMISRGTGGGDRPPLVETQKNFSKKCESSSSCPPLPPPPLTLDQRRKAPHGKILGTKPSRVVSLTKMKMTEKKEQEEEEQQGGMERRKRRREEEKDVEICQEGEKEGKRGRKVRKSSSFEERLQCFESVGFQPPSDQIKNCTMGPLQPLQIHARTISTTRKATGQFLDTLSRNILENS